MPLMRLDKRFSKRAGDFFIEVNDIQALEITHVPSEDEYQVDVYVKGREEPFESGNTIGFVRLAIQHARDGNVSRSA